VSALLDKYCGAIVVSQKVGLLPRTGCPEECKVFFPQKKNPFRKLEIEKNEKKRG
jgi:hypothetical protein